MSKYPFLASVAYNAGAQCPFDNTNLSLPFAFGFSESIFIWLKYKTAKISAQESEPPGCPEFALYTCSIISILMSFAILANPSTFVIFIIFSPFTVII